MHARHTQTIRTPRGMSRQGMRLIEQQDACGFCSYQREFGNTICGQHPISVLLRALESCGKKHSVKFVEYAQSSKARSADDSSVSYASAVVCLEA